MKNVECRNKTARYCGRLAHAIRHSSFVILFGVLCLLFATKSFGQSSNRWLLVFNTSSAMHDRVEGIEGVTQDLLTTAMHGNLRSGDTIGIWTYDSQLRADEAPLLTWDQSIAAPITQHALAFLSRHRYEKSASFGNVLTNMLHVVKISNVITIILVSDAEDPINGTPFDARINAFYKANYRAQRKAHMPIITVFRGEHGVITTNTVSLAPWPADIPPVPPPQVAKGPRPQQPPAPAPESKPAIQYGQPLILTGKKPEPTPPVTAVESTNTATLEPKPVAPEPPAAPKAIEKPNSTAPATTLAKPEPPVPPATSAQTTNFTTDNKTSVNPTASAIQPEVESVATVPSQSLFSGRNIAIVSVTFTVLVCGFLILAARRARSQSQSSLITRSLDREGK